MKLNPDCIRDILIQVETGEEFILYGYEDETNYEQLEHIKKYSHEENLYHAMLLIDYGIVKGMHGLCYEEIMDLTYEGHIFLSNIRENNNWNKIKEICKKTSTAVSMQMLVYIATRYIEEKMKSIL